MLNAYAGQANAKMVLRHPELKPLNCPFGTSCSVPGLGVLSIYFSWLSSIQDVGDLLSDRCLFSIFTATQVSKIKNG